MLETLNTKATTISRYRRETQVRIAKENHRSCRRINSARVHFSIFRQLYFAIIFIARKPLINRTSSPAKLPFPSAIAHAPLWRYKSLRLSGRCSLCRWSSAPAPEGFLLYGDKRPSDFLRRIPLKPGEERAAVLSGAFSSLGPLLISTVAATPIVFFSTATWIVTYRSRSLNHWTWNPIFVNWRVRMAQVVRVRNLKNDSFHKNSIHFFFLWNMEQKVICYRYWNNIQRRTKKI